ncbi:hypothetical protein ABK040_006325 [Willaertia magna]
MAVFSAPTKRKRKTSSPSVISEERKHQIDDDTCFSFKFYMAALLFIIGLLVITHLINYNESVRVKSSVKDSKALFLEAENWRSNEIELVYNSQYSDLSPDVFYSLVKSGTIFAKYAKLFDLNTPKVELGKFHSSKTNLSLALLDTKLLKELNEKVVKYNKARKLLSNDVIQEIEKTVRIEFTYHSNALEGNLLSLDENKELDNKDLGAIGSSTKDAIEALNHFKVYKEMINEQVVNSTITVDLIKYFHSILMTSLLQNAGKFREHNVGIGVKKVLLADSIEVPELMLKFQKYLESLAALKGAHAVTKACLAHYSFVKIHPFSDGNGRIARLIMNLILLQHNYPIAIIRKEEAEKYFDSIENHFEKVKHLSDNGVYSSKLYI